MMKAKYIWGSLTIVTIIGGTIYAIKKSKDQKKVEEESISLEEAKAIVADKKFDKEYAKHFDNQSLVEYAKADVEATHDFIEGINKGNKIVGLKASQITIDYSEYEDEEETEEEIYEDIEGPQISEHIMEEVEELRYDPNSKEAREQYIKMELADWVPNEDACQTLNKLFNFPFVPQNDGDNILRTQIIDFKVQFFGFGSKWTKEVTIADVILHYARAAEFNCGESVKYWAEYFLEYNDLYHGYSSNTIDESLRALNAHTYFNEERATFGLFGLTRESMESAIKTANRNIDRSVTYEIEFNEFLKSCF
jgi:hypothetical protein